MEAKARSLITNKSIKVVSFDVFDTLLDRPVLKPTDIFYLVEKKVRSYLDNDPNFPFTEIRISAEKRAREKLKKDFPTYQDINFDEIYYQFQEITGLSHDQVENIKALELEVELKYLAPKKSVQLLYKLAVKHRKKIVILSDVYLPGEFLIKALKKNGYRDIDRYFVSSELRLTKVSGDLYPLMLKSMGVSPKEVVHIGDNKKADIRKANALAIQTVHIPKAVDLFFGGKCVDHIIWEGKLVILEPSMKIILGFIINKHFTTFPKGGWNNKSLFNGNEFLLGYYGVGPMMLMLVIWIIQHAKNNKVDVIAFAARDGYIPLKIFKMLEPLYDTLPEAIYLRASRSTCIPFDICTKADAFHALSCAHFNPDATALEVLKRRYYLNVTDEIIKHFLDYNIDLDKPVIDKDAFIDACLALGEPLLDGLKQQRELATEYYSEIFQDKKKIAIFDIGYRGRVQKSFSKYLDKDILGLYFSCFHEMASFD
ncbi:MAG: HAD-IA family hydrolase, partial [Pseudomonadota bacterium]